MEKEVRISSRGRPYSRPVLVDEEERRASTSDSGKRGRPLRKSQMIDITALLGLPQRDAALRLGISESMLCKRYKETTKLKWPHRYLGKLEKKIAVKEALKAKNGGSLSPLDEEALQKLIAEKTKLLQPVLIRLSDTQEGEEDEQSDIVLEEDLEERLSEMKRPEKKRQAVVFGDEEDLTSPDNELQMAGILVALCSGS